MASPAPAAPARSTWNAPTTPASGSPRSRSSSPGSAGRAAMFKVTAGSVEEFFRFDPAREQDLRAVDTLIRAAAPSLPRWFFPGTRPGQPGMTITMIGYGPPTQGLTMRTERAASPPPRPISPERPRTTRAGATRRLKRHRCHIDAARAMFAEVRRRLARAAEPSGLLLARGGHPPRPDRGHRGPGGAVRAVPRAARGERRRAHQERWAAEQLFPVFAELGLADVPADGEFTNTTPASCTSAERETGHSSIEHKESPDFGTTSDRGITRRSPFEWQQAAGRTGVGFSVYKAVDGLCKRVPSLCIQG